MGQLCGFIGCCGAYHGGMASILVRLQRRGDLPLTFTGPRFIAWSFADIHLGIQPEFFDAIFVRFSASLGRDPLLERFAGPYAVATDPR